MADTATKGTMPSIDQQRIDLNLPKAIVDHDEDIPLLWEGFLYGEAKLLNYYGPVIISRNATWYFQGNTNGTYHYTC